MVLVQNKEIVAGQNFIRFKYQSIQKEAFARIKFLENILRGNSSSAAEALRNVAAAPGLSLSLEEDESRVRGGEPCHHHDEDVPSDHDHDSQSSPPLPSRIYPSEEILPPSTTCYSQHSHQRWRHSACASDILPGGCGEGGRSRVSILEEVLSWRRTPSDHLKPPVIKTPRRVNSFQSMLAPHCLSFKSFLLIFTLGTGQ